MKYSEPRFTKDLNLWMDPDSANAARLFQALHRFGARLAGIAAAHFAVPGNFYQIGVEPTRVDILTSTSASLTFEQAWERRQILGLFGVGDVPFASKEDVFSIKRASGREEDLLDIRQA